MDDAETRRHLTNEGRWGSTNQRGTLNYITAAIRVAAAALVRTGETVSLAKPIDTFGSPINPRPAWHVMHLEAERPYANADSLHLQIHGQHAHRRPRAHVSTVSVTTITPSPRWWIWQA